MSRRKTHFEQIPVAVVKRLAETVADAGGDGPLYESPGTKAEPYATAISPARSTTVAHTKEARYGEDNG
jgi:hypothetical protein